MKIVLHICCGVCAAGVVERLIEEGHQVSGLFYNPNIHPLAEYQRRRDAVLRVAEKLDFLVEIGSYVPEEWFQQVKSLESEPEGGRRCEVCFRIRLKKTYLHLLEYEGDVFTTTLTVGPRKPADIVNRIGCEIGGDRFLVRDFKKKGGFQRATHLARTWVIHRQDYCGCLYSIRGKADR